MLAAAISALPLERCMILFLYAIAHGVKYEQPVNCRERFRRLVGMLFIDDSAALPSWTSDRWSDRLPKWSDAPGPRPPKRSKSGSAQRSETGLPLRTKYVTQIHTYFDF